MRNLWFLKDHSPPFFASLHFALMITSFNLLQADLQKYQTLTIDPQPSRRTPGYAMTIELDRYEVKSSNYLKILAATRH